MFFEYFDFASCDYYNTFGQMMPNDWKSKISNHDAIYFGAVGWPEVVPDHISLWGSLLKFRREFDQYINLRPVKLMPGVPSPLANRNPGDIDFYIVRENTEGEYANVGGFQYLDFPEEIGIQTGVFTRKGCERVIKYAFDLARQRNKKNHF